MNGRHLKLIAAATVAVLLGARSAPLTAAAPELRFSKPVQTPAIENEELVAATLDSDVYAATAAQFPDVRLLDAAGDEVAYVLRKATTKRTRTERRRFPVTQPTVRPQEDGALEITFEIDVAKHPKPQGITLVTPLRNFERRVSVSTAADGGEWQPLVADALVFDYSQFMDVSNRDLPLKEDAAGLPTTGVRRYRIEIEDVTQEQQSQLLELTRNLQGEDETSRSERVVVNRQPFRIDRIQCWYDLELPVAGVDVKADYPLSDLRVEQDVEAKATYVYVDSRREPLTELTIKTADRNFSRPVRVEAIAAAAPQSTKRDWRRSIGSGTLVRFDVRSLRREELTIPVGESRDSQYRVVIENGDSRPLDVAGVDARGSAYEVVFLAKRGEQYRLAYGGELAAPAYDTAALVASLGAGYEPLAATLGEEFASAVAPEGGEQGLARLLNDPKFLGGVIALLVVLLGVGLYRATRRLDSLPRDET